MTGCINSEIRCRAFPLVKWWKRHRCTVYSSLVRPAPIDEQQLLCVGVGGGSPRVWGSHLGFICSNTVGHVPPSPETAEANALCWAVEEIFSYNLWRGLNEQRELHRRTEMPLKHFEWSEKLAGTKQMSYYKKKLYIFRLDCLDLGFAGTLLGISCER